MKRLLATERIYLAGLALGGLLTAILVIAQAEVLAAVLTSAGSVGVLVVLGVVVCARALVSWGIGRHAAGAAARVKAALRIKVLEHTQRLGPAWLAQERRGELTTLLGRGLDSLDGYLTGYLPQAAIAASVPIGVLGWLAVSDWESGLIVALTLPLIPIFGVLVGLHTKAATERQWGLLRRLGGHFLDVIAGLPTLRAFGRARAQAQMIEAMADAHRAATMKTLRIAFLSALVLELVASVSVALVAVPVGLRLLRGDLDLRTALMLLILAPEAYLPLRVLGAQFHASAEGMAVVRQVYAVLDAPVSGVGTGSVELGGRAVRVELDDVRVCYPGREGAVLDGVSFVVEPGSRVALIGPSGGGKSTLLALLLGFVVPERGRVLVDGIDLASLDPVDWRRQVTWIPQRPHLFAATVADNIRLGLPDASMEDVRRAAREADAADFISALPQGYETVLGERGYGLSAGQRQRIGLARAFLRDTPLVLMDEPTAGLDRHSEARFLATAERLMARRTVLMVAHRPAPLASADRVLRVDRGQLRELRGESVAMGRTA